MQPEISFGETSPDASDTAEDPVRVVVVVQTPPPYMGQAIMAQRFLDGNYKRISLHLVRMNYSKEVEDIGKFKFIKIFELMRLIICTIACRIRNRAPVLYYVPAGPDMIPMYRDLFFLISTRWLFRRTVFHFHAGGISELYGRLSPFLKFWFRKAYFEPDLAISLSELNPPDGETLRCKRSVVIPNAMNEYSEGYDIRGRGSKDCPVILFVGSLRETKGIIVLLDACRLLRDAGFSFKVQLMGRFESERSRSLFEEFVDTYRLGDRVELLGVLSGQTKWQSYADANIFCFPSYYECETFGLVVLEAMQFQLPVVATSWRGIPSLIEDGASGFLVPIKDTKCLADRLALLLGDPDLRASMGARGRSIYLERFNIEKFWDDIENNICMVK